MRIGLRPGRESTHFAKQQSKLSASPATLFIMREFLRGVAQLASACGWGP